MAALNFLWKIWTYNTTVLSLLGTPGPMEHAENPCALSKIQSPSPHTDNCFSTAGKVKILFPSIIRSHPEKDLGETPAAALHHHKFHYCKAQWLRTPRKHPRRQQGLSPRLVASSLLKAENWNQGLLPPKRQPSIRSFNVKQNFTAVFIARAIASTELKLIAQIPLQ